MPTLADVERIREAMKAMPEVKPEERNLNNQEAVIQLNEEIAAMRSKGYTWDQVAEFFTKNGIDIKATTLKSYARRAGAGSAKGRKPRVKRALAAKEAAAQAPARQEPTEVKPEAKPGSARFTPRKDTPDI